MRRLARRVLDRLSVPQKPTFTSDDRRYSSYEIGDGTYGSPEVAFYDAGAKLRIGKFCAIAPKVTILLGGEHHHDWVSNYPFNLQYEEAKALPGYPFTKGDVTIGNDVWLGYGALVLSGITIGDGAVIAARSVVTKDVPPFAIVGGVPAKLIRYRFSHSVIQELLKIAWWDWPKSKVLESAPLLQSSNVDEFIERFGGRSVN